MAFSDYKTIAQVQEEYSIKYDEFTKSKLRITITDLDKIFGTISFLLSSKNETE